MGILNITTDSFFDGDEDLSFERCFEKALLLVKKGADILDIGGESSRPGSKSISQEEETRRVITLIEKLAKTISIPISIDTRKPKVAKKALEKGASFINDITGLQDPEMVEIAKHFDAEVVIMHMQNDPLTMQISPHYPEGIIIHLQNWFTKRVEFLLKAGIKREKIILDPGIGFGKTVEDNFAIISHIEKWKSFGMRVLLGISRKSFMGKTLQKKPSGLLPATLSMNTMALLMGVDIIRVHDVEEHRDIILLLSKLREFS